jgi:PiT family inorganic phosphate transporter
VIAAGLIKIIAFILISPALGFLFGSLLMVAVGWLFFRTAPSRVDKYFRRLQLVSAALYSLGHGGNDAQKTAGIIWMLLIAATLANPQVMPHWMQAHPDHLPGWIVMACYVTIGLGTMFGGWRIVKTMGQKITKLKPVGGFCAETGGAMTLFLATSMGIPVSTTHTITGRDCRCGLHQPSLGRALGRGRRYRVGVGADHSGQCADCSDCLVGGHTHSVMTG